MTSLGSCFLLGLFFPLAKKLPKVLPRLLFQRYHLKSYGGSQAVYKVIILRYVSSFIIVLHMSNSHVLVVPPTR